MGGSRSIAPSDEVGGTEEGDVPARVGQRTPDRRVLVVDPHLFVAGVVVAALSQLGFSARLLAPVTAGRARELLDWRPALALLDVDSIDRATCLSIASVFSDANVRVAAMGRGTEARVLPEYVSAGMSIILDKRLPLTQLLPVIAKSAEGDAALDEEEKQRLLESFASEARSPTRVPVLFDVLTQREKAILAALLDGRGAEDIARRNYVSVSTVRSQIKSVLQKLGVNSQLAATSLAWRSGWRFTDSAAPSPLSRRAGA